MKTMAHATTPMGIQIKKGIIQSIEFRKRPPKYGRDDNPSHASMSIAVIVPFMLTAIKGKDTTDLKDRQKRYMGEFTGRKGKRK